MNKKKQKEQNTIRPVQRESISEVRGEEDFVEFLRRELGWPIPYNILKLSDVAIPHDLQRDFGFDPSEDRIGVSRLLNLAEDQPWGVFLFEFKTKKPQLSHLRKILRVIGSKKTLLRGDPIWDREDLLFICTSDWSQFQFVHFSGKKAESAVISSFGWKGPDDPFLHTLCKHNLPRLRMPIPDAEGAYSTDKWRETWKEAFNIKPVTDEFYATLKEVFDAVQAGITGLDGEERRFFAELVVNRLIFLKFVEKKGWLADDRDYLYNKFRAYGKSDFWGDFLCYLFFEGLCQEPANRSQKANEILGEVPFLNAELFSPSEKWDDWEIRVNNRAFDLLFDKLLNPYNFTVCETSPLEIEVAFNQDLLGYGYEELIADQHGQGAYYTHPTEVNLMCRQSLWAHLENRCPEVSKDSIGRLLYSELDEEHSISLEYALILFKALHEVTVVDPALGSGTFPVAMMKHLFLAQTTLGEILSGYPEYESLISQGSLTDHRDPFALKLHIIERSIYGCDIDYFAVQIAKLRFWIELMVDCEHPEALPNFDCKLVVGDALVSVVGTDKQGNLLTLEEHMGHPTKSSDQQDFIHIHGKTAIEKLGLLKHKYFKAQRVEDRQKLAQGIKDLQREILSEVGIDLDTITMSYKHVLWQIDFAEIFSGDNPGFDVVIANPPYLRQELINKSFGASDVSITKDMLIHVFETIQGVKINGKSDLYVFFFLRAQALARRMGVMCLICSNSWLDVEFGSSLQEFLLNHTEIIGIIDNLYVRSFSNADINTTINVFRNVEAVGSYNITARFITIKLNLRDINHQDLSLALYSDQLISNSKLRMVPVSQRTILINGQNTSARKTGEYSGNSLGGRYLRAPDIYMKVIDRIKGSLLRLDQTADIRFGIKTGANDFFHLKPKVALELGIESRFLVPFLFSLKEISKYSVDPSTLGKYLFSCDLDKDELRRQGYVNTLQYIEWGENQGFDKRPSVIGRDIWYSIPKTDYPSFVSNRFIGERLAFPFIHNILVGDVFFVGNFHSYDDELCVALLNSSFTYLCAEVAARKTYGIGVAYLYGPEINSLQIVNPDVFDKEQKTEIRDIFSTMKLRSIQKINKEMLVPERIELDRIIGDALGISFQDQQEIRIALVEMIESRLTKAKQFNH